MWLRSLILGAVFAASSGCAADPCVVYRGDVSFSAAERAEIERGFTLVAGRAHRDVVVAWDLPSEGAAPWQSIRRAPLPRGVGYSEDARITLDASAAPGDMLARLAAHELGHAWGLEHVAATGAIMSPGVTSAPLAWTAADEIECRRVGVCHAEE